MYAGKCMDNFRAFSCNRIVGRCQDMCPLGERERREKMNCIHLLETEGHSDRLHRKADRKRMIKAYYRSSGLGKELADHRILRPLFVLKRTIHYLLTDVINDKRLPLHRVYDFVNDRLRCIKQDGIVQNLSPLQWIEILPPIARFYAYFAYKLCEENIENFDRKLNTDQLVDVLIILIQSYEYLDNFTPIDFDMRARMESLNLIINANNYEVINRAAKLSILNGFSEFSTALKITMAYHRGDYVGVFHLLQNLDFVSSCLFAALYLNTVRTNALKAISCAYASKNCKYPLMKLSRALGFDTSQFLEACSSIVPLLKDGESILFTKQITSNVANSRFNYLDDVLKSKSVSNVLLKG